MATIKQKGEATKRGRPLNLCRVPEQWRPYGTYISDVTGNLYQTATTCSQTLTALPYIHNHCKMKFEVLEIN